MKIPQLNITIGQYQFDFVHSYEITSSWENLTDTGTIQLPAALKFDRNNLKELIKKGDAVLIQFGYAPNLNTLFAGFVSQVQASVPVVIEVEDLMWKLKQVKVDAVAKNEQITTFLQRVLPQFEFDGFEVQLPKFFVSKMTGAKLLDQIKSDFGFPSYIRNGVVTVGKQYDPQYAVTKSVILNETVKSDDLQYKSKDDVSLNITAISNMSNGQKHEVIIGDQDGESRTLNFYNIPKNQLQEIAEAEAEKFIYDGFRGSLTLFGEPFVRHGDILHIQDNNESDKQGKYFIDQVIYQGGVSGFSQTVKLGARAI